MSRHGLQTPGKSYRNQSNPVKLRLLFSSGFVRLLQRYATA
jgi:hypothetical protein